MFVTVDDFKNYWGWDLRDKLASNDNPSVEAEAFLRRVEIRLMNWIDRHTFRNYQFSNLSQCQLEHFKYAILEQAKYMWREGDLAVDSGYDQETGLKLRPEERAKLIVCLPAQDHLINGGLMNFVMKNRARGWGGGLYE